MLRDGIDHYVPERDPGGSALARERDQLDASVRYRAEEIQRINNSLEMRSRLYEAKNAGRNRVVVELASTPVQT